MSDDGRVPARLHPDDLAALAAALQAGPVRMPPAPAEVPSGIDARVISEAVRAIVGEKTAVFLTRDQIEKLVIDTVARGGLEIDDVHREETAEAIRAAIKWHKRLDKVVAGLSLTILTALAVALLKLLGINLPSASSAGGGG